MLALARIFYGTYELQEEKVWMVKKDARRKRAAGQEVHHTARIRVVFVRDRRCGGIHRHELLPKAMLKDNLRAETHFCSEEQVRGRTTSSGEAKSHEFASEARVTRAGTRESETLHLHFREIRGRVRALCINRRRSGATIRRPSESHIQRLLQLTHLRFPSQRKKRVR